LTKLVNYRYAGEEWNAAYIRAMDHLAYFALHLAWAIFRVYN